jgi:predicted TIM-barrel fold metal-dependent hydrolase
MFCWYREVSPVERRTFWACFGGWALDALDVQMFSIAIPALLATFAVDKAQAGAERLLWASDWPHTQFESATRFAASRALLDTWIPSPAERAAILGDTPAQLFRCLNP